MVLAAQTPYAGSQVWDSNFLPAHHQGVRILPGDNPIPNLQSSARSLTLHQLEQRMLRDANELHAKARPGDLDLRARMSSFRTALGMMQAAPEVLDTSRESTTTRELYGLKEGDQKSFAWQCLISRRLVERGVRVVELIHTGSNRNWDHHGDMAGHRRRALDVDHAVTGLIRDLKERGLLGETLVAITTEFGRTPWYNNIGGKGRNHFADAFCSLLLGAGVRGGMTYGETDEYGIKITADPVHVHDYHATILHLMGLDHTRVTYRYAGRDFRLTDVGGNVLHPCLV